MNERSPKLEKLLIWAYQNTYAFAEECLNEYCEVHNLKWESTQPYYNLIAITEK